MWDGTVMLDRFGSYGYFFTGSSGQMLSTIMYPSHVQILAGHDSRPREVQPLPNVSIGGRSDVGLPPSPTIPRGDGPLCCQAHQHQCMDNTPPPRFRSHL